MNDEFLAHLYQEHTHTRHLVPASATCHFAEAVIQLLFPPLSEKRYTSLEDFKEHTHYLQHSLKQILDGMVSTLSEPPEFLATSVMNALPRIHAMLLEDADAIAKGDPAAQSIEEVIRTYPGFKAVALYRLAHEMYRLRIPLLPRVISEFAHARTGIDIHPGASIGEHFCIDHGTGVVIGETTIIGNSVKVYQGVTLGAISVEKSMANIKRHPTIEDHVIIYAGATILGGNTVIGTRSIIGGNVWLTESIPPYSRVYHHPQIKVRKAPEPEDVLNFSI
ncbi:serine acetyltransferase [Pontibacter sp. KCTC 32443]|uniref:serine O-acetyltransferase EpsC n=1 Tax=Pontibacter TaxID=323449 RepID=UPI00164E1E60|nr:MULTISPECIES: serine O-acetyltransferase EpsC [Pontibacter]MBC5775472.1 serine acetyltransferase [Pontibacter sp. KCTC 32443]